VCRASRDTRANLGLMACRTYVKTAIVFCQAKFDGYGGVGLRPHAGVKPLHPAK
jgi:hypothetical protein